MRERPRSHVSTMVKDWGRLPLPRIPSTTIPVAVFGGGWNGSAVSTIDTVVISSVGNATSFGSLVTAGSCAFGTLSSSTRGVFVMDGTGLQFITIATTGSSQSFGSVYSGDGKATLSNSTRGLVAGAWVGNDTIQFVTIATAGNGSSFGVLSAGRGVFAGASSTTRGVFAGAMWAATNIDFVTIATTGNATVFGNLTVGRGGIAGMSSGTRAVFAGGDNTVNTGNTNNKLNTIDFVTIATTGNATNFGTLTQNKYVPSGTSSKTRGLIAGGGNGSWLNTIEFIDIPTAGNGTNFGSLTVSRGQPGSVSSGHGGLE